MTAGMALPMRWLSGELNAEQWAELANVLEPKATPAAHTVPTLAETAPTWMAMQAAEAEYMEAAA